MAGMDASIFLLLLIALVALAGVWLLQRPLTRKESDRFHESRMDSYGIPGETADGAQDVGANSDGGHGHGTPGN